MAPAVLALIAVLPFGPLLDGWGLVPAAAVAIVVVTAISYVLSPRWPVEVTTAFAAVALGAGGAVALVATGTPVGPALLGDLAALPTGWRTFLSSALPLAVTPQTLALPVLCAAAAAFAGAELAVRSRWPALSILPPVGVLVVALVVGGRATPAPFVLVAVLVGAALVAGSVARMGVPRPGGLGLALLAALACVAVRVPIPAADRVDPRDFWSPAPAPPADVNPLDQVALALGAPDDPVVFHVTLTPPPPGPGRLRMRVATLDEYDPDAGWKTSRSFAPVGSLLPRRYEPADGAPRVVQRVTLEPAYTSPLVPVMGTPVEVREPGRDRLRYDDDLGDLQAVEPGGLTYEVVSAPGDPAGAPQAPLGDGLADETVLPELPEPPERLRAEVRGLRDLPARQRVEALAQRVQGGSWGYDPGGAPGQMYPRLAKFLADTPFSSLNGIQQPTAVFAVLARLAGVPSRVVVGYNVTSEGIVWAPSPERTVAVRAKQADAWVEVHLDGEGWVAFDAHPPAPRAASVTPEPSSTTTSTTTPLPAGRTPTGAAEPSETPSPAGGPCAATGSADPCDPDSPSTWRYLPGLVAVAPVAIVGTKRARRRRRRRRTAPNRRLVGAWQETVACVRSRGLLVPPTMTAAELAVAAVPVIGEDAAAQLARWASLLDVSLYAPGEPGVDLADEAWNAYDGLVDALRGTTPVRRRILIALDPRPLFVRV